MVHIYCGGHEYQPLKHHTYQQAGRYLNIIHSHELLPVITEPTRIASHTATVIDYISTNTVHTLYPTLIFIG